MTGVVAPLAVIAGLLVGTVQCAAWGPDDCCDDPWVPDAPVVAEAAPEPLDPIALGFHVVTEVRAEDVVTRSGLETTYQTTTRDETPGTFARMVASVGTGEVSAYDGLLSEQRLTLSDGRAAAGDIYETVVVRNGQLVVVGYDIFHDDSELARLNNGGSPTGRVGPAEIGAPAWVPAPVELPAGPTWWGVAIAPDTGAPGAQPARTPGDVAPPPQILDRDTEERTVTPPAPRDARAYVALAPQADAVSQIEVLRGRRTPMWIRATVDGAPARVISWRLVSGEVTALGPVAGRGEDPFVARWSAPSGRAAPFALSFEAQVESGAGARPATAVVSVTVRSPALVE